MSANLAKAYTVRPDAWIASWSCVEIVLGFFLGGMDDPFGEVVQAAALITRQRGGGLSEPFGRDQAAKAACRFKMLTMDVCVHAVLPFLVMVPEAVRMAAILR